MSQGFICLSCILWARLCFGFFDHKHAEMDRRGNYNSMASVDHDQRIQPAAAGARLLSQLQLRATGFSWLPRRRLARLDRLNSKNRRDRCVCTYLESRT